MKLKIFCRCSLFPSWSGQYFGWHSRPKIRPHSTLKLSIVWGKCYMKRFKNWLYSHLKVILILLMAITVTNTAEPGYNDIGL